MAVWCTGSASAQGGVVRIGIGGEPGVERVEDGPRGRPRSEATAPGGVASAWPGVTRRATAHVGVVPDEPPPPVLGATRLGRARSAIDRPGRAGGAPAVVEDPDRAPDQVDHRRDGRGRGRTPHARRAGPRQRSRSRRAAGRRTASSAVPRSGPRPAGAPRRHRRRRRAGDDVGAVVHAVGEVHVEPARRTEHRGVARRPTAERVAPRIGAIRGTPRPRRSGPPAAPRPRC